MRCAAFRDICQLWPPRLLNPWPVPKTTPHATTSPFLLPPTVWAGRENSPWSLWRKVPTCDGSTTSRAAISIGYRLLLVITPSGLKSLWGIHQQRPPMCPNQQPKTLPGHSKSVRDWSNRRRERRTDRSINQGAATGQSTRHPSFPRGPIDEVLQPFVPGHEIGYRNSACRGILVRPSSSARHYLCLTALYHQTSERRSSFPLRLTDSAAATFRNSKQTYCESRSPGIPPMPNRETDSSSR